MALERKNQPRQHPGFGREGLIRQSHDLEGSVGCHPTLLALEGVLDESGIWVDLVPGAELRG